MLTAANDEHSLRISSFAFWKVKSKAYLTTERNYGNDPVIDSVSSQNFWTRSERKLWLWIMLAGCIVVYAARTVMPICVIPISQEFNWNKTDSGWALSAFFWGYSCTQIVGGYMSDRWGGERVMCVSVASWSIVTFLTPHIVRLGSRSQALFLFVISRVITGAFQGLLHCFQLLEGLIRGPWPRIYGFHFPSLSSLFSKKISESERGFSFSFASSGTHFGTILNGWMGSLLLDHVGWNYPFYVIGLLGLLWVSIIYVYLNQSVVVPVDDPLIEQLNESDVKLKESSAVIPWFKLLTASPFWALVLCQFCSGWSFYILLSWIPTYFHENFPTAKGWMFNVIPWALSIPFQWVSGWLADFLIVRGHSTTFTRKLIQTISFGFAGLFLYLMTSAESFNISLFYISTAVAFLAFSHGSIGVNSQDIAPECAGSVFGMMNTAGAIPGFIGVYVTGYMLEVTRSWDIVFSSTAAVCWIGCFIFIAFGTGKRVV